MTVLAPNIRTETGILTIDLSVSHHGDHDLNVGSKFFSLYLIFILFRHGGFLVSHDYFNHETLIQKGLFS